MVRADTQSQTLDMAIRGRRLQPATMPHDRAAGGEVSTPIALRMGCVAMLQFFVGNPSQGDG